jgi:hypothetical protein
VRPSVQHPDHQKTKNPKTKQKMCDQFLGDKMVDEKLPLCDFMKHKLYFKDRQRGTTWKNKHKAAEKTENQEGYKENRRKQTTAPTMAARESHNHKVSQAALMKQTVLPAV